MGQCIACSSTLKEGTLFCPQCGTRTDAANPDLPQKNAPLATQHGMPIPQMLARSKKQIETGDLAATQPLAPVTLAPDPSADASLEGADSTRPTMVGMSIAELETQMSALEARTEAAKEPIVPASPGGQEPAEESGHVLGALPGQAVSDWAQGKAKVTAESVDAPPSDPAWAEPEEQGRPEPEMGLSSDWSLTQGSNRQTDFEDEVQYSSRQPGGAAYLILAVLLMLGSAAYGVYNTNVSSVRVSIGEAEHVLVDGLVRFAMPISTSVPVNIVYPGGRRSVNGESQLRFAMDAKTLKMGQTPLMIRAEHDGVEIPITSYLKNMYALRMVSADENQMEFQLDLAEKYSVKAEPGSLERLAENSYRWVVSRKSTPGVTTSLTGRLTVLHERTGDKHVIAHTLRFPSLSTPLKILSPLDRAPMTSRKIEVSGLTLPFAQIKIDAEALVADENGRFKTTLRRARGTGTIRVESVVPKRKRTVETVKYQIVDKKAFRAGVRAQRKDLEKRRGRYEKAPTYQELMTGVEQPMIVEGVVLAHHRTGPSSQALVVSLCEDRSRCPVWIDYEGVHYAQPGKRVSIAASQVGKKVYIGRDNVSRTVPRLNAQVIAP